MASVQLFLLNTGIFKQGKAIKVHGYKYLFKFIQINASFSYPLTIDRFKKINRRNIAIIDPGIFSINVHGCKYLYKLIQTYAHTTYSYLYMFIDRKKKHSHNWCL